MLSFLAKHTLTIQLNNTYVPALQRRNDEYIMDILMASNHYTPAEIRKLNYCRLFLNVTTITDITKPCGTMIDNSLLNGVPSPYSSRSNHLSIHQENPSPSEWKLWRRAYLIWSDINGKLRTPLGEWIHPIHAQRNRHFAYQEGQCLWLRQHDPAQYREYRAPNRTTTYSATFQVLDFMMIPSTAIPVGVQECSGIPDHWHVVALGQSVIPQTETSNPADMTFLEFIHTLDEWEVELLKNIEMDEDPFELCVALQPLQRSASDGSVRHHRQGAFGWTIRNENGQRVAAGMGPASGSKPTSYRAEAYGMLSLLRFLIRIKEYTSMHFQWEGIIATDSQSLLDTLNGVDELTQHDNFSPSTAEGTVVLDVLAPDWDVLIEIQKSMEQLPRIKLEYVKGHQDRDTPYPQLSQMAQLNVDADAKAGQYQDEFGAVRPLVKMMTNTGAHLIGPDGTITSHYRKAIRYQATEAPLRDYLMNKYQWNKAVFEVIHWPAHGVALRRMNKRRIHYTKMIFDILPTHSQSNKRDGGKRTCPTCEDPVENRDHILRCAHGDAVAWREELKCDLTDFYRRTQTEPELARLLTTALAQWFSTPSGDIQLDPTPFSDDLRNLIIEQNAIGWRQIFSGRFSQEWSVIQQAQYHRLRSTPQSQGQRKRTGDRWQAQLIGTIWKAWDRRWAARNKAVHGHNATTRQQAIRREVQRQLDTIYQQKGMMEPSVQELLYDSPEDHQLRSLHTTRNWLAQHTAVFKESIKRVRTRAIQGVRSIRSYFQPSSNGG